MGNITNGVRIAINYFEAHYLEIISTGIIIEEQTGFINGHSRCKETSETPAVSSIPGKPCYLQTLIN